MVCLDSYFDIFVAKKIDWNYKIFSIYSLQQEYWFDSWDLEHVDWEEFEILWSGLVVVKKFLPLTFDLALIDYNSL